MSVSKKHRTFNLTKILEDAANRRTDRDREVAFYSNSSPCEVCESVKFIKLYRNVVGEVDGRMRGSFDILGGSISGYISGSTKTLPVLSCANCHNERLICTWHRTGARDIFWGDMHYFYFGFPIKTKKTMYFDKLKLNKIDYLNHPLETRQYMLDNKNYNFDFYNEMIWWQPSLWAKAGFQIQMIPETTRKFLFFFTRKVPARWPTWRELKQEYEKETQDVQIKATAKA